MGPRHLLSLVEDTNAGGQGSQAMPEAENEQRLLTIMYGGRSPCVLRTCLSTTNTNTKYYYYNYYLHRY